MGCWFFDGSKPRFNSHKLIPLLFNLFELFFNFDLLFLMVRYNFSGKVNLIIKIGKPIIILILLSSRKRLDFLHSFEIPNYDSSIKTTSRYHIVTCKTNSCHMGTMPLKDFMHLLWNVAGVFEESNALIIVTHCYEISCGVSADCVYISVIWRLEYSLNWESEFLGPSCPFFIFKR